jgi:DNA-binding NarL/FixJ family response regulator
MRPGDNVIVEHGTLRRASTRMVMDLNATGMLTEDTLRNLVERFWKVAVITVTSAGRQRASASEAQAKAKGNFAKSAVRRECLNRVSRQRPSRVRYRVSRKGIGPTEWEATLVRMGNEK